MRVESMHADDMSRTLPTPLRRALLAICGVCLFLVNTRDVASQFLVRELNTDVQQIVDHYQAYSYLTSNVDQGWLERSGFAFVSDFNDFSETQASINLGTEVGAIPGASNGFFLLGSDYAIDARAEVTIPEGTWTIAINTDDGGQLTLPGADFFGYFGVNDPLGKSGPDQFWYNGQRTLGATGASFTVGRGGLTTTLYASMHQRAGGGAFELVVRPGGPGDQQPDPAAGWVLLSNGAMGWTVTPSSAQPVLGANGLPVGSGVGVGPFVAPGDESNPLGIYVPAGDAAVLLTIGDGADFAPGLNQRWYNTGNAGTLLGQVQNMVSNDAASVQFHNADTWWDGNSTDLQGIQGYPAGVAGAFGSFSAAPRANNDEYLAWLSGDINLNPGETRFRFGAGDYAYLAIDTGGNGIAGDQPGEVLFNANESVSSDGTRGNEMSDVGLAVVANGGWYRIEAIVADGSGSDSAVLYWDADSPDNFPQAVPFRDAPGGFAPEDYAVPSDRLRSTTRGGLVQAVVSAQLDGAVFDLEISSALADSDKIIFDDPGVNTVLDLSGATINITALDGEELTTGDQWQLFFADSVVGLNRANIVAPPGLDLSGLIAGTTNMVIFGDAPPPVLGIAGDIDGDGSVGFGDFLILSASFGQFVATGTSGDIDGDGSVGFGDFLILSNNFGQSATEFAAVPEPATWSLGLLGLCLCGLRGRRRKSAAATFLR